MSDSVQTSDLQSAAETGAGRYRASRRATAISIATNIVLSVGQVIVGVVGHSQALVADGFHTLSDLFTDILVLFAAKHGAKDADAEHPYGHARIETAMTAVLSAILVLVGAGIVINAGIRLSTPEALVAPSLLTLVVALFTIAAKEGLYRYTVRVARRVRSDLLRANAWHHRSDAFSSVIVAVGIAGSIAGLRYLDAVAAIGVAFMVVRMGVNLGLGALRELIDTGLDQEQLERVREVILSVSGVKTLHLLRTRRTGGLALVDVHILVDETVSVSEGHQISERVRERLMTQVDGIADVMVHIDPEDDESSAPNVDLPLRDVMLARLARHFQAIPEAAAIEHVALHYLGGKIHVELLLPLQVVTDLNQALMLRDRFQAAVKGDAQIGALDIHFH